MAILAERHIEVAVAIEAAQTVKTGAIQVVEQLGELFAVSIEAIFARQPIKAFAFSIVAPGSFSIGIWMVNPCCSCR
jgi:hypothetical protein